MKNSLIYLVLLFFPLLSFSQINTSLDFVGGIDYSYRNMTTIDNPSFSDTFIVRSFDENEIGKINFRFGFNFNKRISKNTFFKTGLRLANIGYQRKYEEDGLRWGSQQSGGVFDPQLPGDLPTVSNLTYNYLFIEVPLIARYEFSQKKFTPFVELGVSPSIFLKSRLKITDTDGKANSTDHSLYQNSYSSINLVGVVSIGGNYTINENLQFFAQPTFRYHFTRLFKEGSVKEYLWNVGLEVGIRKRLN